MNQIRPSGGPEGTYTREELLRARNQTVTKVKKPKQKTPKRNRKRKRP